jgi:hypothetical protein
MTRTTASLSLADKLAGLLDWLLGREVHPAPVYVPVAVRRPVPVRIPVERR